MIWTNYLLLALRKVVLIGNGLQGDCQGSLVLLAETATSAPKSAIYCPLSQVPVTTVNYALTGTIKL